ncbi:hypothetical protein [Pseudomonas kulmbachensis]|uniref:Uncharacterized protein n=1 Tax=Pseudomonas kulmbachensis TaxID=3043408 RepID=A0ABW7LV23_9PSED
MNQSTRAYCDVALAMHQRRNMSAAIHFGLVGLPAPKNSPRYQVQSSGVAFFHIIDTRTGKVKGFRRDHNAACAFARKLEQE